MLMLTVGDEFYCAEGDGGKQESGAYYEVLSPCFCVCGMATDSAQTKDLMQMADLFQRPISLLALRENNIFAHNLDDEWFICNMGLNNRRAQTWTKQIMMRCTTDAS